MVAARPPAHALLEELEPLVARFGEAAAAENDSLAERVLEDVRAVAERPATALEVISTGEERARAAR